MTNPLGPPHLQLVRETPPLEDAPRLRQRVHPVTWAQLTLAGLALLVAVLAAIWGEP